MSTRASIPPKTNGIFSIKYYKRKLSKVEWIRLVKMIMEKDKNSENKKTTKY